jgi:hypothetical protein
MKRAQASSSFAARRYFPRGTPLIHALAMTLERTMSEVDNYSAKNDSLSLYNSYIAASKDEVPSKLGIDVSFVDFAVDLDNRSRTGRRIVDRVTSMDDRRGPCLEECAYNLSNHGITKHIDVLDYVGKLRMGHVLHA